MVLHSESKSQILLFLLRSQIASAAFSAAAHLDVLYWLVLYVLKLQQIDLQQTI